MGHFANEAQRIHSLLFVCDAYVEDFVILFVPVSNLLATFVDYYGGDKNTIVRIFIT